MQTLREIRNLLRSAGLRPQRRFAQNFLIDRNLMDKLLALAEADGRHCVLEVGAGSGSLTEELLTRCRRVVAVEIDRGLFELLRRRLGTADNVTLICGDVLAGKHELSPRVLEALDEPADLVANLPYSIATPLIADCLRMNWLDQRRSGKAPTFERMTFTVQQEVAERFQAAPGRKAYGPVSVLVSLLGRITAGPAVPTSAFWPTPKVAGRMLRIDFDPDAARRLDDAGTLAAVLAAAFAQRRKQIRSLLRRKNLPFAPDALEAAMSLAGIDLSARAEAVTPQQYLIVANALAKGDR